MLAVGKIDMMESRYCVHAAPTMHFAKAWRCSPFVTRLGRVRHSTVQSKICGHLALIGVKDHFS
jgi:hypothetical protein